MNIKTISSLLGVLKLGTDRVVIIATLTITSTYI